MSPSGRPRVSVIVRTRNRPAMLTRALDDIAAQVFEDYEVIVVDDGDDASEVGTVAEASAIPARIRIADRTAEQHARWRAANAGVDAATGEYIVLHDDDDLWEPDFLSATVGFLDEHPDSVAVTVRTDVVVERDEDGVMVRVDAFPFLPEMTAVTLPDMLRGNRVVPISLLYRRSLHDEIGPYESALLVLEDWEFYLRIMFRHPIELLDGPIRAHWSHRPDSAGDAGNSIVFLEQEHRTTDDRIRDAFIRDGIERDGPGVYVHLAREMQWLDRRLDALQKQAGETNARVESRLQDTADQLTALGERTSALSAQLEALGDELRRAAEPPPPLRSLWTRLTRGAKSEPGRTQRL